MELYPHQKEALAKMKNGCILCGGVGSGKSLTGLSYYIRQKSKPLYIITTARKRDTKEWEEELSHFDISQPIVIDSWNNIKKYVDTVGGFFIFDEQRLVGYGTWTKSFLKITKSNEWILLSATPGDTWSDYIAVFIANGFYKNKSEFVHEHVIYSRFAKYPRVDRYVAQGKLIKHRNDILIKMDFERKTVVHNELIFVDYNSAAYKDIYKTRWDPYENTPVKNASEMCFLLRRLVNSDPSRQLALLELIESHPKVIIFYNFNYELAILKDILANYTVAEWNGHKHEPIPNTDSWAYLVQYSAGAEGWNCIETDTIIFFSQNYSYKVMVQAAGRINRLNTPFVDLYYYHLRSRSGIDLAIANALKNKKSFNESGYFKSKGVTF